MIENALGLTASYLQDPSGTILHIPYRISSHGFFLFSKAADLALVVVPVSAVEDPRYLRWLGQRGIYRIESPDGSLARVGEGRVIDRLRRHRSAPMLIPGRVSAAFRISRQWSYPERRYMEARLAASWIAAGNTLTSRTFNWTILNGDAEMRQDLDPRFHLLERLLNLSDRILDNDADEFVELLPRPSKSDLMPASSDASDPETEYLQSEVRLERARQAGHLRVFPNGCRLRFEDGRICALASVRRNEVILHPGSKVYRITGGQAGRNFKKIHDDFLRAAGVSDDGQTGTTRVAVVTDSAAFLLKNVTGGRIHVASRWQLT